VTVTLRLQRFGSLFLHLYATQSLSPFSMPKLTLTTRSYYSVRLIIMPLVILRWFFRPIFQQVISFSVSCQAGQDRAHSILTKKNILHHHRSITKKGDGRKSCGPLSLLAFRHPLLLCGRASPFSPSHLLSLVWRPSLCRLSSSRRRLASAAALHHRLRRRLLAPTRYARRPFSPPPPLLCETEHPKPYRKLFVFGSDPITSICMINTYRHRVYEKNCDPIPLPGHLPCELWILGLVVVGLRVEVPIGAVSLHGLGLVCPLGRISYWIGAISDCRDMEVSWCK
jgi:hypothetical protein